MRNRQVQANDQTPQPGRLIVSPPGEGGWNMALDQALLEQVQADSIPVLRFYRWSMPTLSLGYFQNLADRARHTPSREIPVVRRSTGGGAIIHDQELTYSLCLPLSDRFSRSLTSVYGAAHDAIIAATAELGIKLTRFADSDPPTNRLATGQQPASEPFLCFQRRTADDLVFSGYKLVGSAQRRSAHALLQHGGILLRASRFAPELPGLQELSAKPIVPTDFISHVTRWLADELNIHWGEDAVPSETLQNAKAILKNRFQTRNWTERRP